MINHFFCDLPAVFKLACGDTFVNEIAVYVVAVVFIMVPFLLIVVSYGKIISNILKLRSARGGLKPSPLACLTSQWWSYSTAQPLPLIYSPNQINLKKLGS